MRTPCLHLLLLLALLGAQPVSAAKEKNHITVESGDTLFGLVRTHYPNQPSRWSMIENEIYVLNPHAFKGGNKSMLLVGAYLEIPVYEKPKPEPEEPAPPPEPPRRNLSLIGNVMEESGIAVAVDLNHEKRPLNLGGDVFRGDAVQTQNSEARLHLSDGTQIHLRPHSGLVIEEHSFDEAHPEDSRSIVTLLGGGFRVITGLIGKRNPASIRINTAVATLGIAGTDFGVRICQVDECSSPDSGVVEAGFYAGVLDGVITISNNSGTTGVSRGEFVRTVSADSAPETAPEAAQLIFSSEELAPLVNDDSKPMGFFEWLGSLFFADKASD